MNKGFMFLVFLFYSGPIFGHPLVRGRPVGRHGLLGLPAWNVSSLPMTLPDAQWYEQRLDHFDPTNSKTWKQVSASTQVKDVHIFSPGSVTL